MIRFLLLISLVVNFSYAGSEKYFIQFGSFKDLKGLEQHIAKLPSNLRSHVVIVRSNAWYIPFAYYTSNKNALKSKLPAYKRYFKDARIAHSSYMLSHPLVRNYATTKRTQAVPKRVYTPPVPSYRKVIPRYQNVGITEEDNILVTQPLISRQEIPVTQKIVTQKVVMRQVEKDDVFSNVKPKKYKQFSKEMLSGHHYYLAYKKTNSNPSLLIKVSFGNHQVTYKAIIGDMKMTNANYLVEGGKLYMFADTFTRNGSFSTLEEHRDNHFLVASWSKGKKLNTLRYYYKMNDAKAYLDMDTSDGLAEILSEGDYDDFFVDE